MSSPLRYFPSLRARALATFDIGDDARRHIAANRISRRDVILIGGGGLINALNKWNDNVRAYCAAARCVLWSVGRNRHLQKRLSGEIDSAELASMAHVLRTREDE